MHVLFPYKAPSDGTAFAWQIIILNHYRGTLSETRDALSPHRTRLILECIHVAQARATFSALKLDSLHRNADY